MNVVNRNVAADDEAGKGSVRQRSAAPPAAPPTATPATPKSRAGQRETRRYSSPVREEAARLTRRKIVEAAAECFTRDGYTSTTLRGIAKAAGVSVETVNAHGPKGSLLFAAFELAFMGREGQGSVGDVDEFAAIRTITDSAEYLRRLIAGLTGAFARADGIWRALTAAVDVDEAVARTHVELVSRRRADFAALIGDLQERGIGVGVDEPAAIDVLSLVCSPESYHHLVVLCGWNHQQYERWVERLALEHLQGRPDTPAS